MASSGMYRLQPILDSAALHLTLPTCMYRLPPINPGIGLPEEQQTGGAGGAPAADLAQLERRQEAILARLTQLRGEVEAAQRRHGDSSAICTDDAAAMATEDQPTPKHRGDIVVVASPSRPPLSLLLLRRLAPGISLTAHLHSTCPAVDERLSAAFGWRGAEGAAHVRVIWKPVEGEPRLLVSPSGQCCPLLGESQVFRYIARALLPSQYEAAPDGRAARVDRLLDLADTLGAGGRERQAALRSLSGLLDSHSYLLGPRLSLVDGVVWSALRGAGLQTPPGVTAWAGRVAAAAGLDDNSRSEIAPKTQQDKTTPKTSNNKPALKTAANSSGSKPPAKAAPSTTAAPSTPPSTPHLDQAGLMSYLSSLGIASDTVTHPAVFTVQAMMPYLASLPGAITKNLFLKDRKGGLYLLTARHDAEFRLADVAKQVPGAKELRFADEGVLFERLGVRQGCVTPLALVNDRERAVRLLVDGKMVDGSFERLWFHPLTNEATTGMSVADFRRFAVETGHEPTVVNV